MNQSKMTVDDSKLRNEPTTKPAQPQRRKLSRLYIGISLVVLVTAIQPAIAGGPATGGASEVTQLVNMAQLINSYAQQVDAYVRQGQQYATQLQNLQRNPLSIMGSDVTNMVRGIGQIMSAGQAMGGSLAQIDKKFASTFNSPTAASFSTKFLSWTDASKGTLQGAMQAAGMHRDAYASNTDALRALYDESQSRDGNLAAIQTLSKINAKQVESIMALGDLMATQNIASNAYMAAQNSKEQARLENNRSIMGEGKLPVPKFTNKNSLISN